MPVFRIEKTRDFTIMSNHHLRNRSLSLKAKGLQSLMLSLPEQWDFSQKGLAQICKDGIDSIGTALLELEKQGYLTRRQLRDEKGKYLDLEYTIHELPVIVEGNEDTACPMPKEPYTDCPEPVFPDTDNPDSEKHVQSSINNQESKKSITHKSNIHPSIRNGAGAPDAIDAMDVYREVLKDNIGYEALCQEYRQDELDEILELMLETVCSTKKTFRVGGEDKPSELVVKSRMLKLDQFHVDYVLDALGKNITDVRNIRSSADGSLQRTGDNRELLQIEGQSRFS